MNILRILAFLFLNSALFATESAQFLLESYKNFADDSISVEKKYILANSAMDFGLFETAAEIYESLISRDEINSLNISREDLRFSLVKAYIGSRNFDSAVLIFKRNS